MISMQENKVICWLVLALLSGIQSTDTLALGLVCVGLFGLGAARAAYVLYKMKRRVRKGWMSSGPATLDIQS